MSGQIRDADSFVIVIPSLNPDERFLQLLQALRSYEPKEDDQAIRCVQIVVVNDGSSEDYDAFFEKAKHEYDCVVLKHAVNLGKGRALKNAFNYSLLHYKHILGIVTLDADGQHTVQDAYRCAQALSEHPDDLILGCRDFDDANIPFKSKMGNKITRRVFRILCGVHVSDTQTGLRALPMGYVRELMNVVGERFEFEMNMLIECKKYKVSVSEVPIQTIYLDDNKSSHFNPLVDSLKIYSVFIKYVFAGLSSFFVDMLLFSWFITWMNDLVPQYYILLATISARIVSSILNYLLNRKAVFQSQSRFSLVKYYILVFIQMCVSGLFVSQLYPLLSFSEVPIKIVVDVVLFFINYVIQRNWVFKQ